LGVRPWDRRFFLPNIQIKIRPTDFWGRIVVNLRRAELADAAAIADLHAASWLSAYRGIVSDAYLDDDLVGNRRRHWAARMQQVHTDANGFDAVYVLERAEDQRLIGFVALWDETEAAYDGFIDNLHVAPGLRGGGLGRLLLQAAAAHLRAAGRRSASLWVLDENLPAYGFYCRVGGVPSERKQDEFAGKMLDETRMVWTDMPNCAALMG
jgi:ribosomal protein S18 acetylase RimI-like enzyme